MNFLGHNPKQKVYIFQKTEQEVWPKNHFPLDQGYQRGGGRRLDLGEPAKALAPESE